jgi:hypothetical protein
MLSPLYQRLLTPCLLTLVAFSFWRYIESSVIHLEQRILSCQLLILQKEEHWVTVCVVALTVFVILGAVVGWENRIRDFDVDHRRGTFPSLNRTVSSFQHSCQGRTVRVSTAN